MISHQIEQKVSISSHAENINIVEKIVNDIKELHNLSEDCFGNMLVAVTEAVSNAINHGNKKDPSKQVEISHEIKEGRITFIIIDQGEGFDHYNLPDPTAPENLEKPNGRGIFLMKHLSDQIIFSENGRKVELYFKIIGTGF